MKLSYLIIIILLLCQHPLMAQATTVTPKKHWDWLVLPAFNFTTDRGIGYGVLGGAVYREEKQTKGFDLFIAGQFFQTTKGYHHHKLFYDFPKLISWMRLDGRIAYESWKNAPYYGEGNTIISAEHEVHKHFYSYGIHNLWIVQNARIPLKIDPRLQFFFSYSFRYSNIDIQNQTLAAIENKDGKGGVINMLSAGVVWDSRNEEPSTQSGILSELSYRVAHRWIKSDYDYQGMNFTHRQWFPLIKQRLVLAWRFAIDYQQGNIPFYQSNTLGGNQWIELGGYFTMRGYALGRFRGNLAIYQNLEARFHWKTWHITSSKTLGLSTVPWVDLGYIYANQTQDTFYFSDPIGPKHHRMDAISIQMMPNDRHLKADAIRPSFGIGKRLIYNDVLVLRIDFGFARESMVQQNDQGVSLTHPWVKGFYVMIGQLF
jgi:hypothetical protein